jgi:hypothetical protein
MRVTWVSMMETANTSKTSVNFYQSTRRNIPEDCHFYTRRCGSLLLILYPLTVNEHLPFSFDSIHLTPAVLLTSADPHWITTGSRRPLTHPTIWTSKQYTKNTQTVHNKQIHKLRNILFNSQTKKYTKIRTLILMGRLMNLIFNLQFQIPSLLQSVLKFSISDFAFLRNFKNVLGKII